jgi:hypothetical protein
MRVVAIDASDQAAALPEAFGVFKRGNLAGDQEIAGHWISVIDIAEAGVALSADLDRYPARERFGPNGPAAGSRQGFNVIASRSVAAFAAHAAVRSGAQRAGLSVATQAFLFERGAEDPAERAF